jgi:hypothetical protein
MLMRNAHVWESGHPERRPYFLASILLTSMVFFGALLLFSMQPLVGRMLTPYFGGAAHVWLACLMFFQGTLFIGYFYAHVLVAKIGRWHLIFLLLPLINLPLMIEATPHTGAPVLLVLATLILNVALPFVALSTTAVTAQSWFAHSQLGQEKEPYHLYAASNAGSFIALFGYAFLIEPFFSLQVQSRVWTFAYLVYLLIVAAVLFQLSFHKQPQLVKNVEPARPIPTVVYLRWFLLSGVPSAFLLAATNHLALEVGSFPFVWVIPLALYLGSFIVTFRTDGGIPRLLKVFWLEFLLAAVALSLFLSYKLSIAGFLIAFFAICITAHGILYELRPTPSRLTNFYLTIAAGGWIGGVFVSLLAPYIFSGLYEMPILLAVLAGLFWWHRDEAFIKFWPEAGRLTGYGRLIVLGLILFPILLFIKVAVTEPPIYRHRNFYGTYRISDKFFQNESLAIRRMFHGKTLHGGQIIDPERRIEPLFYYHSEGPIADIYNLMPSPNSIGIIGLGAGTMSAYQKEEDHLTYYEIDPDNEKIARAWFSYLDGFKGDLRVIVGDGRLSMQDWQSDTMKYDIILIDAFTGDGIPTHLLTTEAINIYITRLKDNGIVLFHISNRYYDLRSVLKSNASHLGLHGAMNILSEDDQATPTKTPAQCVAIVTSQSALERLVGIGWQSFGDDDGLEDVRPWIDQHINILVPLWQKL